MVVIKRYRHLELVFFVDNGIRTGVEPDIAEEVAGTGAEFVGVLECEQKWTGRVRAKVDGVRAKVDR